MIDSDIILTVYNINRSLQEISLKKEEVNEAINSLMELKKSLNDYTEVALENLRVLYKLIENGKGSINQQQTSSV